MTNEIANVQNQGIQGAVTVSENDRFAVKKGQDGKFFREMKYSNYTSVQPDSEEKQIKLFNILHADESEQEGRGMKDHKGAVLEVHHVITRAYDSIDEQTGEQRFGALTYIFTDQDLDTYFITSSKAVYNSINEMMSAFGYPDQEGYKPFKVQVYGKKGQRGEQILIKRV